MFFFHFILKTFFLITYFSSYIKLKAQLKFKLKGVRVYVLVKLPTPSSIVKKKEKTEVILSKIIQIRKHQFFQWDERT